MYIPFLFLSLSHLYCWCTHQTYYIILHFYFYPTPLLLLKFPQFHCHVSFTTGKPHFIISFYWTSSITIPIMPHLFWPLAWISTETLNFTAYLKPYWISDIPLVTYRGILLLLFQIASFSQNYCMHSSTFYALNLLYQHHSACYVRLSTKYLIDPLWFSYSGKIHYTPILSLYSVPAIFKLSFTSLWWNILVPLVSYLTAPLFSLHIFSYIIKSATWIITSG